MCVQAGVKKQIAALKTSLKAATVDAEGYDEALQVRACVRVCVRACVCLTHTIEASHRMLACVCVCVCERERECVGVCVCVLLQLKRGELEDVEAQVEEESKTLSGYEGEAASLQHGINATLYEKQRALEKLASIQVHSRTLAYHSAAGVVLAPTCSPVGSSFIPVWLCVCPCGVQRTLGRYDALSRGRRAGGEDGEAALAAAEEAQARVRTVIDGLVEAHPGMSEVLHRVAQLLDV